MLTILIWMACGGPATEPVDVGSLFEATEVNLPPGEPKHRTAREASAREAPARAETPECASAQVRFEEEEASIVAYRTRIMGPIVEAVDRASEDLASCMKNPDVCGMDAIKMNRQLKSAEANYEEALGKLGAVEARLHPIHQELLAACGG